MADLRLSVDEDGLAELVLARPPVNALSPDMLEELEARVGEIADAARIRAMILRSEFRVFSAGMDLRLAQGFDRGEEERTARAFTTAFRALYSCPKPVVCALSGAAIAGGFFFPACADVRLAVAEAKLGLAEVRVGATLPAGPLEIARAELPPGAFRRLLLTGAPVAAEEAAGWGFIDRIVPPGALMQEARAEAARLAELPPEAFAATKADLRAPALARIEAAMARGVHDPGRGWFLDETRARMRAALG